MSLRDPHCTNLDRRCLICGNLLGKNTLAKEKYITQLNSVLFINITKDLLYYILTIFHLKHMKTGVPMITIRIRTVRTKLNEEVLEKIKNTSKNDRKGCPFLLKFGQ